MGPVIRVLVTAVGGDLGQAVVKALRLSSRPLECHGCDVDPDSVGRVFVDEFHGVPPASEVDGYREELNEVCRSRNIHVVIPASDAEIDVLSRVGTLSCGSVVVSQPAAWIDTYGDKLRCMRALDGHVELAPFADGADAGQVERLVREEGYPLVIKARRSSGSRSLSVAKDERELAIALAETASPLVQAYIGAELGEYSVAVFACDSFEAVIGFRRKLGPGGSSWLAETTDDEQVLEYARKVSRAVGARGSINVQVRKGAAGVRLLEINPRFSSLAAARALCGFRDVEWSLDLALGDSPATPAQPFRSIRFRRFLGEAVDLGEGFAPVAEWGARVRISGSSPSNQPPGPEAGS